MEMSKVYKITRKQYDGHKPKNASNSVINRNIIKSVVDELVTELNDQLIDEIEISVTVKSDVGENHDSAILYSQGCCDEL